MVQRTLLTASEAAHLVGVTSERIGQICREHEIGFRFGRAWALTMDDVQAIKKMDRKIGRPKKIDKPD